MDFQRQLDETYQIKMFVLATTTTTTTTITITTIITTTTTFQSKTR